MHHSRMLTVNGVETFFYEAGEGPTVVMLHGMASNAECWHYTLAAFQRDYRVIVPDLPGHGKSTGVNVPYSLAFFTAWLHALLEALEVETVTLMGNSMGGAVALAFTQRYPARVSQLVLANPLGVSTHIPWDSAWRLLRRAPHGLRLALTGKVHPHLVNYVKGRIVKEPTTPIITVLTRMIERNVKGGLWMLWAGVRLFLVDFLTGDKRRAFAGGLSTITTPTLITWGRFDGLLPVRNATEAKAHMPRARVRVFNNSAHMPMLEEPEVFEALVRDFLHRNGRQHVQPETYSTVERQRTAGD